MRKLCKCYIQNCCHIAYAASEFTPLSGTAWGNGGAVTANYQHTHFTLAMKRWRVWQNYEVGLEGRQLIKRWQPDPELKLKAVGGPIAKSICQLVCCQSTYEAWKRVIRVEALTGRSCKVQCSARTTSFANTIPTTASTTTTTATPNTYITISTAWTISFLLLPLVLLLLYLLLLLQVWAPRLQPPLPAFFAPIR